MKKRIVSFICTLSVIACMIPVNAAPLKSGYDTNQAAETLKNLNIINGEMPQKVLYDYYVRSLACFLYSSPPETGNLESIARSTGMLDSGEMYKGNKVLTADDAVKYAVVTLGYKTLALQYGGDSGAYRRVAAELGITAGVNLSSGAVDTEAIIKILYQMMDIEPMSRYFVSSAETGYAINYGETLLSLNRNIYEVKGIQNANSFTSLYQEDGCVDGYIMIDGTEFEVDDEYTDYLGKRVVAYVQKTGADEYKVLYMHEEKNDILSISAENIEDVDNDYSYVEYIENNKIYKAKLSPTPAVIYNGVLYGEYTKEDLMPDIGSLELTDNDSDGRYDIIEINSYKTVVVDSVNYSDDVIKSRYDFDDCLKLIELEDDEIRYSIEKDGVPAEIAEIKALDVLCIAESKSDNNKLIKILISEKTVSGAVTGINNNENEISIDGTVYPVSSDFTKQNNKNNLLKIGRNGTFYIDAFGNIAYFRPASDSEYYMLLRIYEDDEKLYAVYMDLNQEWSTIPLADRITYNGTSIKSAEAYNTDLQYLKTEVVKLGKNADGELKKLETAYETGEYVENKFTKTPEASYTYRYYEQHFDHKYYLNEGAKAFVIPGEYTSDKTMYSVQTVTSLFDTDTSGCQISVYDADEFNFTDVISIKDNSALESARSTLNLFVVKDIGDKLINGDVVYGLTGNMVNYRNLSLAAEKPEILDNVEQGDIIRLSINSAGEISGVSHVASSKNFVPMEYVGYTTNAIMAGTVSKVDLSEGKIKISFGTNEKNFRLNTTLGVLTYNVRRNECSFDDISSVTEDKNIICRLKMGRIEEIVIIDEE